MKLTTKHFKHLIYALMIGLFAMTAHAQTKAPKKPMELFFTITARSGSIAPIKDKTGNYRLTLHTTNPYVVYFANTPSRVTGLMDTTQFIQKWTEQGSSFKKNPPNGNLEAVTSKRIQSDQTLSLVFALSEPNYNAKAKTLTFLARATHDEFPLIEPLKFNNLALFIDGLEVHDMNVCFGCVD